MDNTELLEISDLIVSFDTATMDRRSVDKADVFENLRTVGDFGTARIVAARSSPVAEVDRKLSVPEGFTVDVFAIERKKKWHELGRSRQALCVVCVEVTGDETAHGLQ